MVGGTAIIKYLIFKVHPPIGVSFSIPLKARVVLKNAKKTMLKIQVQGGAEAAAEDVEGTDAGFNYITQNYLKGEYCLFTLQISDDF